jgi:hypothetical protein
MEYQSLWHLLLFSNFDKGWLTCCANVPYYSTFDTFGATINVTQNVAVCTNVSGCSPHAMASASTNKDSEDYLLNFTEIYLQFLKIRSSLHKNRNFKIGTKSETFKSGRN